MAGRGRLGILILALVALAATPARAQLSAEPAPPDAELRALARLHVEIDAARDEFFDRLGSTPDETGRAALREELNRRIDELLAEAGTTQEEYQRRILEVSSDAAGRESFERAIEEARSARPAGASRGEVAPPHQWSDRTRSSRLISVRISSPLRLARESTSASATG